MKSWIITLFIMIILVLAVVIQVGGFTSVKTSSVEPVKEVSTSDVLMGQVAYEEEESKIDRILSRGEKIVDSGVAEVIIVYQVVL